jgi:hypothetical protein
MALAHVKERRGNPVPEYRRNTIHIGLKAHPREKATRRRSLLSRGMWMAAAMLLVAAGWTVFQVFLAIVTLD